MRLASLVTDEEFGSARVARFSGRPLQLVEKYAKLKKCFSGTDVVCNLLDEIA